MRGCIIAQSRTNDDDPAGALHGISHPLWHNWYFASLARLDITIPFGGGRRCVRVLPYGSVSIV